MKLRLIKEICLKKNIPIRWLAEDIGISEPGLHQMIRTGSMKADVLEKICIALNADPVEFFERYREMKNPFSVASESEEIEKLKNEVQFYKKIIEKLVGVVPDPQNNSAT